MANPARFLSGISTDPVGHPLANYPHHDPFHPVASYKNDFDTLIGTDFTVTGTSSTFALTDGLGGLGLLTPGGATTATSAYKNGTFLQFVAGKQFWFVTRFQVSALAGTEYVGLQKGSATTDGLWFAIDASGAITLVSTVGSSATTLVASTKFTDAVAATYVDLAFYYDGTDLLVYQDDALVARVSSPTIGASATTLTNAVLGPVFQITPTTGPQTLTVDYVLASSEVTR